MMIIGLLIFVPLATVAIEAVSVSKANMVEWRKYKTEYGKIYKNEKEEEFRMQVYLNSSREVREHSKLYADGKITYEIKINKFSDLLDEEFEEMMSMNDDKDFSYDENICEPRHFNTSVEVPDEWDWREKGAVGQVKDQKDCRCSWAFSATGALEGHHFLRTNKFVKLSEQNLIDCARGGGQPEVGFQYVAKHGIDSEKSYPFEATKNEPCYFKEKDSVEKIKGCRRVSSNDEQQLKIALYEVGPISVTFCSKIRNFKQYAGGIIYDEHCSTATEPTSAGVLVAYTTKDGKIIWKLQYPLGQSWGNNGYIYIATNNNSPCFNHITFPV